MRAVLENKFRQEIELVKKEMSIALTDGIHQQSENSVQRDVLVQI